LHPPLVVRSDPVVALGCAPVTVLVDRLVLSQSLLGLLVADRPEAFWFQSEQQPPVPVAMWPFLLALRLLQMARVARSPCAQAVEKPLAVIWFSQPVLVVLPVADPFR
jgi:hypothetical protein